MDGLLAGKRILVTGVTTHRSIAFAIAQKAQEAGAEVALTSFGKRRPMTERAARRLSPPPPVLELDVRRRDDVESLGEEIERRWGRLDGLVHAIAHGPPEAISGEFLDSTAAAGLETIDTSAVSLHTLAGALRGPLEKASASSIVAIDFDSSLAWRGYNWMGVAKAGLESIARYLALEVGPLGIRVNLVSAGPLDTPAAQGCGADVEGWSERAPLGWNSDDPSAVALGACFLLSDWSRAISGEILHVDGGHHAVGIP